VNVRPQFPFEVDVEVVGASRETVVVKATCGVHARRIVNKARRGEYPCGVIIVHSHRRQS